MGTLTGLGAAATIHAAVELGNGQASPAVRRQMAAWLTHAVPESPFYSPSMSEDAIKIWRAEAARPAAALPPSGFTSQSGLAMPDLAADVATPALGEAPHLATRLDKPKDKRSESRGRDDSHH